VAKHNVEKGALVVKYEKKEVKLREELKKSIATGKEVKERNEALQGADGLLSLMSQGSQ
jgi:hypothetical protein